MNRETEMMHAAIKILNNRAEQYEYSDYLMHATKDDLEENKNRMLNQSRWERNRRETYPTTHAKRSSLNYDPDIQRELSQHGYVNTTDGKIIKLKGYGGYVSGYSAVDNDEKKKVLNTIQDMIDDIPAENIRVVGQNGAKRGQNEQEVRETYIRNVINDKVNKKFKSMTDVYMTRYADDINYLIKKRALKV